MSEEEYISIVGEIFDGYTEFEFSGQTVYLKHFSIRDQRYIHVFYQKYKNLAIKKGVPTQEESIQKLIKEGLWSDEDDLKIANLEVEIESLKQTQRNLILPSQKKIFQEDINSKTSDLLTLRTQRANIIGTTAEDFASKRANEEFIRYIVYKDKSLQTHLFSEEDFSELEDFQIKTLVKVYSSCGQRLNETSIQEAVLRDFFQIYMSQAEDVSSFFGKPVIDLSVYQLKLAAYAKIFLSIFQNNSEIPENIKKDPVALLGFSENKRAGEKIKAKSGDSGATAVFGATKEDLSFIDPNAKKISLTEELEKQGGSMSMDQMIKLMHG